MKMVQWNLLLFPSPKNCSNCVVTWKRHDTKERAPWGW